MAFEMLSNAEECGYNPRVGDRTYNSVEKPYYLKLSLNEVLALIGPDVHLIHGRSWRGGHLCTAVFLCKDPKEDRGLKHPRCAFFSLRNVCALSQSVLSDSLWPCGRQLYRLLFPWDFPRQEYWSGFPCSPPGILPDPGTELMSLASPALAGGFFTTEPPYNPHTSPNQL